MNIISRKIESHMKIIRMKKNSTKENDHMMLGEFMSYLFTQFARLIANISFILRKLFQFILFYLFLNRNWAQFPLQNNFYFLCHITSEQTRKYFGSNIPSLSVSLSTGFYFGPSVKSTAKSLMFRPDRSYL